LSVLNGFLRDAKRARNFRGPLVIDDVMQDLEVDAAYKKRGTKALCLGASDCLAVASAKSGCVVIDVRLKPDTTSGESENKTRPRV